MRILFLGTSAFAVPSLGRLLRSPEHRVLAVVTQPDRPHGRGGKVSRSPIKDAAVAAGLTVLQPEKVRVRVFVQSVRDLAPDVLVVAAFGQIIPQRMLDIPPYGGINVHGSLLPRWRGAAPMQYALMAGDPETGVTTMQMDAGLDTGDILLQGALPLSEEDNLGTLEPRLAELGADLLIETLARLGRGDCPRTVQDEGLVTQAPSLPPTVGEINWEWPARELHNLVRGVTPRPGAFTLRQGKRLKIQQTAWSDGAGMAQTTPGVIINMDRTGITVGTGKGALRLVEVQPESKAKMTADAWARGAHIAVGDRFDSLSQR